MSTVFAKSVHGRRGFMPQQAEKKAKDMLAPELLRKNSPKLPELSELDVIRHFTELSHKNFSVDGQLYPLGSCTMKYNPRFCEQIAMLPGFARLHPLLAQIDENYAQGVLEIMWHMEQMLCEITGMSAFCLHPMAGAHGELAGLMIIDAYHKNKGVQKNVILVPDSAHGTNPASAALAGFDIINIPSKEGIISPQSLEGMLNEQVAALMLTCPNTLGLFEKYLPDISEKLHRAGALLYYDGANANAILGKMKIGDAGFDVVHLNLHKTFATPHGGGGPGAGPVGVCEFLIPYLPVPRVDKKIDGSFFLNFKFPQSIGKIAPFYGNFSVILKAYSYILRLGARGLERVSDYAVLNANYLRKKLEKFLEIPHNRICLHEFVATPGKSKAHALDIAKALIDNNIHPPTIYFPLIINEALMFEPTETESKQSLDTLAEILQKIMKQAEENIDELRKAPVSMPVRRLDETAAARNMILTDDT